MKRHMELRRSTCLLVFLLFLLMSGCSGGRSGDEGGVASLRPGESLQEAIDRAEPGSVLRLAAGTWDENIVISKSLTLRGAGRDETVVRGVESGYPVVRIGLEEVGEGPEVAIESLQVADAQGTICAELRMYEDRLRGDRRPHKEVCPYGVLIEGSADVSLSDCLVSNNRTGVVGIGTATIEVRNCEIRGNDWEGIYVAARAVVVVHDSVIIGNGAAGVGIANEASASISECTIEDNIGDGVGVADLGQVFIVRCTITGNAWSGVKLVHGAVATLDSNRIVGNSGFGIAPLSGDCYQDEMSYIGKAFGEGNWIPGPEEPDGNAGGAICPEYPGDPWPEGFLSTNEPAS